MPKKVKYRISLNEIMGYIWFVTGKAGKRSK
jgi:hypothetical protein